MSSGTTAALLYATVSAPAELAGGVPEDAKELRHHLKDGKGFMNPWDSYTQWNPFWIARTMAWRYISGKGKFPDTTPPTVPIQAPEFLPTRSTPGLRATWLGHACYYVEFPGGFRVLFDPVFTCRCSPFSFMGPKRFTEPPCEIADIPYIDAVIISHSHYDHLSHPTIKQIQEKHPNAHFFVPLGNRVWFEKCGIHNVTELDWWEQKQIRLSANDPKATKEVTESDSTSRKSLRDIVATIGALPSQHTSARSPFDKDKTLWASWSISSGGKSVWFAGDTGYRSVPQHLPEEAEHDYSPSMSHLPHCPAFAQIGQHRGPFDLGLIPIGAYKPRFVMSPMHANPRDSANIFLDTKCRRALGMHWGTWVLTEEPVLEPPKLLRTALRERDIPEEGVFDVCNIGESRTFGDEEESG